MLPFTLCILLCILLAPLAAASLGGISIVYPCPVYSPVVPLSFALFASLASSVLPLLHSLSLLPFPAAARKLGEATSAPCCSLRILRAQTVRFILARLSDSPLQAPRGVRTPLTAPTVSLHHPLSPSILLRHFRHFSFFMPRWPISAAHPLRCAVSGASPPSVAVPPPVYCCWTAFPLCIPCVVSLLCVSCVAGDRTR